MSQELFAGFARTCKGGEFVPSHVLLTFQ